MICRYRTVGIPVTLMCASRGLAPGRGRGFAEELWRSTHKASIVWRIGRTKELRNSGAQRCPKADRESRIPEADAPFSPLHPRQSPFFSQPARPRVYQTLEAKYFTPRKKKQASCPDDRVEKPVDLKKKPLGIVSNGRRDDASSNDAVVLVLTASSDSS